MNDRKKYLIQEARLKKACLVGMELAGPASLRILPSEKNRYLFLGCLDGTEPDCLWGRWKGNFSLSSNMAFVVHAFAGNKKFLGSSAGMDSGGEEPGFFSKSPGMDFNGEELDLFFQNPGIDPEEKLALFGRANAASYVSQEDVLMYGLRGRYLWICVEVMGEGEGTVSNLCMVLPGDTFLSAFPEAYQEWNSFFHRYLSVFSSIYNDFQEKIDTVEKILELDTAAQEQLRMFAAWMGVDISGNFLSGERLRTFVKEIHRLNKWKGTRKSLELLTEIILDEKAVILERNILKECAESFQEKIYDSLYGSSPYGVTLLIRSRVEKARRSQLYFLLQQFVPVRCELNLVFLEQKSNMDTYCYLDINARLWVEETVYLNERMALDGNFCLPPFIDAQD